MYINGEWIGKNYETRSVINPANQKKVGTVPNGGKKETTQAIDAAHEAFQTWSKTNAYERAGYLEEIYELIVEHEEDLAETMTIEMGKPLNESRVEVK